MTNYTQRANRQRFTAKRNDQTSSPGFSRTSERRTVRNDRNKNDKDAKPRQPCKAYALTLLAKREYTAKTLSAKLQSKGYDADEIAATMAFLQDRNFQSDERYAQSKTRQLENRSGNAYVNMALTSKGIAEELARSQVEQPDPEPERAKLAIARFQSKVLAEGMTQPLRQKIYRALAQRGFNSSSIRGAIRWLAEECETEVRFSDAEDAQYTD